jgi:mRNA interferase RelE/StbE
MQTYQLEIDKRVQKDLESLSTEIQDRVLERLESLTANPFAPGTIKLKGEDLYRVRVGDYRIIFDVDTKARVVIVLAIAHRSQAYR